MLTNLFIRFGWSRDDLKWGLLQLSTVAALISSNVFDVPYWCAYLGIPLSPTVLHWIFALSALVLWVSGRYNSSPLPSANAMASGNVPGSPVAKADDKVDVSKIGPLVLVLILAGGAVGCALKDARHQAVVGSSVLYTAISGVDDSELALSQAGAITSSQHAQLNPKVLTLLRAGKAANAAIIVWRPGEPTPAALQAAVTELGKVATAVIDILPDSPAKASLQTKILLAQHAALLLLAFGPLIGGA